MSDVLSIRLDLITAQLSQVSKVAELDQTRVDDLNRLCDLLNGTVKEEVRDVVRSLGELERSLQDLEGSCEAVGDPEGLRACLGSLGGTLQAAQRLEHEISQSVRQSGDLLRRHLKLKNSQLSKITLEAFETKGRDISQKVKEVRKLVQRAREAKASGAEVAAYWNEAWEVYRQHVYLPARMLFEDYTDFLLGVATRDSRLDEGICSLADELIRGWNAGVSLTLPAKYVALENALTRIVRLSFQDWSFWALPLVAAEVGQVISAKDIASGKLEEFIRSQAGKGRSAAQLRELLAEVFATSMMGPAYCYACIFLRFDPAWNPAGKADHARDGLRAEVMLGTLGWLSGNKLNKDYDGILTTLRQEWTDLVSQAGLDGGAEKDGAFAKLVDEMAGVVCDEPQTRFSSSAWGRAQQMKAAFLNGDQQVDPLDDLRAVLNGAWLARAEHPSSSDTIRSAAEQAFRQIMTGRVPKAPPRAVDAAAKWQGSRDFPGQRTEERNRR